MARRAEQGEQRVRREVNVVQLETGWLSHVQPCRPLLRGLDLLCIKWETAGGF